MEQIGDDFVESILKTSGFSVDELLVNLQHYKTDNSKSNKDVGLPKSQAEISIKCNLKDSVILTNKSDNQDATNICGGNDRETTTKKVCFVQNDHDYCMLVPPPVQKEISSPPDADFEHDVDASEESSALRSKLREQFSTLQQSVFFPQFEKKWKSCSPQKRVVTKIKQTLKVYLDVEPRVGCPIVPSLIHLLPFNDTVISDKRAKFASSVVSTERENTEPEKFTFCVSKVRPEKKEERTVRQRVGYVAQKVEASTQVSPKRIKQVVRNQSSSKRPNQIKRRRRRVNSKVSQSRNLVSPKKMNRKRLEDKGCDEEVVPVSSSNTNKREQSSNVEEDPVTKKNKLDDPVFEGELKVSLKENKHLLTFMGTENVYTDTVRILPWSNLIESFQSGKMSIWSRKKGLAVLLCNVEGYPPPKRFVDIGQLPHHSEMIEWILTDTLPPECPRDLMHVILTSEKRNFSISGYCLRKTNGSEPQDSEEETNAPSPKAFEAISVASNEIEESTVEFCAGPVEELSDPETLNSASIKSSSESECTTATDQQCEVSNATVDGAANRASSPMVEEELSDPETLNTASIKSSSESQCTTTTVQQCEVSNATVDGAANKASSPVAENTLVETIDDHALPLVDDQREKAAQSSVAIETNLETQPPETSQQNKSPEVSEIERSSDSHAKRVHRPIPVRTYGKVKQKICSVAAESRARTTVQQMTLPKLLSAVKTVDASSLLFNRDIVKLNQLLDEIIELNNANMEEHNSATIRGSKRREETDDIEFLEPSPVSQNDIASTSAPVIPHIILDPEFEDEVECSESNVVSLPVEETSSADVTKINLRSREVQRPPPIRTYEKRKQKIVDVPSKLLSKQCEDLEIPKQLTKENPSIRITDAVPLVSDRTEPNQILEEAQTDGTKSPEIGQLNELASKQCELKTPVQPELPTVCMVIRKDPYVKVIDFFTLPSAEPVETLKEVTETNQVVVNRRSQRRNQKNDVEMKAAAAQKSECCEQSTQIVENGTASVLDADVSRLVQSSAPIRTYERRKRKIDDLSNLCSVQEKSAKENPSEEPVNALDNDRTEVNQTLKEVKEFDQTRKNPSEQNAVGVKLVHHQSKLKSPEQPKLFIASAPIRKNPFVKIEKLILPLDCFSVTVTSPAQEMASGSDASGLNQDTGSSTTRRSKRRKLRTDVNLLKSSSVSQNSSADQPNISEDSGTTKLLSTVRKTIEDPYGAVLSVDEDVAGTSLSKKEVQGSEDTDFDSLSSLFDGRKSVRQNTLDSKCTEQSEILSTGSKPTKKNLSLETTTVTSNETESSVANTVTSPTKNNSVGSVEDSIETNASTVAPKSSISIQRLKCTHQDIDNVTRTLLLTNYKFEERKLHYRRDTITVSLPKFPEDCTKWCMLYINSKLAYMSFIRSGYTIKRKDLADVVEMSKERKSTIRLRNKNFTKHYNHPKFGIFCVPEYQDRVFLGPYSTREEHHIGTLQFVDGQLLEMSACNKLLNTKSDPNPTWIYEIRPDLPTGLCIDITDDNDESVIDITNEDDDPDVTIIDVDDDTSDSLFCPPFAETLTVEQMKSRSNINRYIMTNIPYLGYFEAYQGDGTAIEVFWGDVGYRFANTTLAKHILIYHIAQIFSPIPQDFEIKVIVMTDIDTQTNVPIDAKYFSKDVSYVCGEFGFYEKYNVPQGLLRQHRIESPDGLSKPQASDEALVKIFGSLIMPKEEFRQNTDIESILRWAISEIDALKRKDAEYEREKRDLQAIVLKNSEKVKETATSNNVAVVQRMIL